jgi:hypothetical protein
MRLKAFLHRVIPFVLTLALGIAAAGFFVNSEYEKARQVKEFKYTVKLRVNFLASGEIGNIAVLNGETNKLTEKAVENAQKIKFQPEIRGGKPIGSTRIVQYTFTNY